MTIQFFQTSYLLHLKYMCACVYAHIFTYIQTGTTKMKLMLFL